MMKFLEEHYKMVVLFLLALIFTFNTTVEIAKKVFPASNDVIGVLIEDSVKKQVEPLMAGFESLEKKVDVLYYNAADEWVRLIDKQYDKLQSNASNLYWLDVEYVIGKWPKMPEDYKTAPLVLKMNYIQDRYNQHIANGGGI